VLGSVAVPREVSDDRCIPHQEPRQLLGVNAQDAQDAIPAGLRTLCATADGAAGIPGATGGEGMGPEVIDAFVYGYWPCLASV